MRWHSVCAFLGAVGISVLACAQSPLRVIVFPGGANLPLWVAEEKGFFVRENLAVKITPTPNSVVLVQSLLKGDQDVALSAFDNIVAYQEGQGEVALGEPPDFFAFMAFSRGTVRLVANPEIRSYADLKGRTLAVDAVATGYSLVLVKLLALAGLQEGDYQLESIGGTATRARALLDNKTPATILTTPLELMPEARGFRRLANVIDVVGPYQTIVGMSRRSWAAAHREALVGFTRASVAAIDWLYRADNRMEAAAIYRKYLPDVTAEAAGAAVAALLGEREGVAPGGRFDNDGMLTVLKVRSEFGRPRKTLDDPGRYVDDSFLRAAGIPR